MKKRIVSAVVAVSMLSSVAFAEQPKASEYRNIMSSGTYYIEYESAYGKQALAVQGAKRMSYTTQVGGSSMGALSMVPVVGIFSMFGGKKETQVPNALYQDGKYYKFKSTKEALVANENQLNDPNLNPAEGWDYIKYSLTFPEAFVVFAPNDELNAAAHYTVPQFVESGTETLDGKSQSYDKYVTQIKSATGKVIFEKIYRMYYGDNGELTLIKNSYRSMGENEENMGEIKVKKISGELPDKIMDIPNGCKVYRAGVGDMDDLLDHRVLVEDYSK